MNKELTAKLVNRFPVIYQGFYDPMQVTAMCWGFDHGDGWFDIIWQLSLAIEDELGYTKQQEHFFRLNKLLAKRWNKWIYKLSPVVHDKMRQVGSGVKSDPYHYVVAEKAIPKDEWFRKICRFLLPEPKVRPFGFVGSLRHLGFKAFVWHPDTGFKVNQVKEKYGTLRFYCPGTDRIHRLVTLAERLTQVTCEECGKSGELRSDGGWMSTRCDDCWGTRAKKVEEVVA